MSRTLEPPPVSHTVCYDPPVPWSPQLARARMLAHASTPPQALGACLIELRTAHRRHGIARCACALGSMCRRTGAVCAGTCGARCATPPPIQSTPARAWQASPGCECCARQAPSFERRLHVPARHPSSTGAEDPATRCGAPTNRQARVGRGVSASSETRGHASSRRKMRAMSLLVSIVVCVLT